MKRDPEGVMPAWRPSWLPLRCGLVLLLRGGAMRFGSPTVHEALRQAHWVPAGRGMRW